MEKAIIEKDTMEKALPASPTASAGDGDEKNPVCSAPAVAS